MRQAWSRLVRKQWLILYPLALSVLSSLAFFAVYAADGKRLSLSDFLNADFSRWTYLREHLIDGFSASLELAVAIAAGLVFCALAAMVQAAFFRAVAGPRYPLAPRGWGEAGRLFAFYLVLYAIMRVLPLIVPVDGIWAQLTLVLVTVFALAVIFADFVIVFEDANPLRAVRRSLKLLALRFLVVVLIFLALQLIMLGVDSLYGLYYKDAGQVFILLPISRMLVESLVLLITNLVLIFLYEDIRRHSPS